MQALIVLTCLILTFYLAIALTLLICWFDPEFRANFMEDWNK